MANEFAWFSHPNHHIDWVFPKWPNRVAQFEQLTVSSRLAVAAREVLNTRILVSKQAICEFYKGCFLKSKVLLAAQRCCLYATCWGIGWMHRTLCQRESMKSFLPISKLIKLIKSINRNKKEPILKLQVGKRLFRNLLNLLSVIKFMIEIQKSRFRNRSTDREALIWFLTESFCLLLLVITA